MALQQELWIADIQENIKMNAAFLSAVTSHDAYVVGSIVHIPQAGSVAEVIKNRTVLPATASQRTDTDLTYAVNSFSITPIRVSEFETKQITYEKRASVAGEAFSTLTETIAHEALLAYATGTARIETSGAADASIKPAGATQNRLKVTHEDIANMAKELDKQGVPSAGRKLLMQTDMFYQLMADSAVLTASYNGFATSVIASGVVAKLYGFEILTRPFVAVYNGATAKAYGATGAANDSYACIAWHPAYLAKALSTPKVFLDVDSAEHYGSIFSAVQWAGFSKMRSDSKGVVALVQKVSA